jgi:hypothetical protein
MLFDRDVGGMTLPAHSGVENLALLNPSATDGFVVTYVPAALNVPYQTIDKKEYYIRAGSNFLPAPHGVLAGMFGRRPQPETTPIVKFVHVRRDATANSLAQTSTPIVRLLFELGVRNSGRTMAEDIFLLVEAHLPSRVISCLERRPGDGHQHTMSRMLEDDGRIVHSALVDGLRLPPGTRHDAFNFLIDMYPDCSRAVDYRFAVSFGSIGGPGAAKEVRLPARLVYEVFEHFCIDQPDVLPKQTVDEIYETRIRECLK